MTLLLLLMVGCTGNNKNGDGNTDANSSNNGAKSSTEHIVSVNVTKGKNSFTLHAVYTSPEYIDLSSISAKSFESPAKIYYGLKPKLQTKNVDKGYSVDVMCTYSVSDKSSYDYKLECDDLNDDSASSSARYVAKDEILLARWKEYKKTEFISFGAVGDIVSGSTSDDGGTSADDTTDGGSNNDGGSEQTATDHIVSVNVTEAGNSFTLHAIYTSPDYIDFSSISAKSFDSSAKIYYGLKPKLQSKKVAEGYSVDVMCTYTFNEKYSEDKFRVECDDLNDGLETTTEHTLAKDEIILARWKEYGKTEFMSFGPIGSFASETATGGGDTTGGGTADDSNATEHILSATVEQEANSFTLHALYTSPDYADISSISAASFDSSAKLYFGIKANVKSKKVSGGYSVDVKCTYTFNEKYSENKFRIECDDLNDGLETTTEHTLAKDEIILARWKEYGKTEFMSFGPIGSFASETATGGGDTAGGDTNTAPTAVAGDDVSITEGDTVSFDASNSSDDVSVDSYQWSEGNTTLSDSITFSKSDFSVGTHTIVLTVTDDKGLTGTDTIVITVEAVEIPLGTIKYNETFMHKIGTVDTYNAQKVTINGHYAYVADAQAGVKIFDITDPKAPLKVGDIVLPSGSSAQDVVVSGNYAYIAAGGTGLQIADISDPEAPLVVGNVNTSGGKKLILSGNYIYMTQTDKLNIIDVSTPSAPVLSKQEGLDITDLHIDGNHLYLTIYSMLYIYNISNPTKMTLISRIYSMNGGEMVFKDNMIYAFSPYKITIIDISEENATIAKEYTGNFGYPRDTMISGNHIYVASIDFLDVYDISTALKPKLIGRSPIKNTRGLALTGNIAYTANTNDGLTIFDITTPKTLLAKEVLTLSNCNDIKVDSNYIYTANRTGGINIIDRLTYAIIGTLKTAATAEKIAISGNYLYVINTGTTEGLGGFQVIDITIPSAPKIVSSTTRILQAGSQLTVKGNYAYLLNKDNGLIILDISNPLKPKTLSTFVIPSTYMTVYGNYVYSNYATGYYAPKTNIIDITDPSVPVKLATDIESVARILIDGNIAYTTDGYRFSIIDMTDPKVPSTVSTLSLNSAWGILVSGNFAYVEAGGLTIIDISVNTAPTILATVPLSGNNAQQIFDNKIYCASNKGISVIDISELN